MCAISRCTCQDFTDARRGTEHRICSIHLLVFGFQLLVLGLQLRTFQTVAFFCVSLGRADPLVGTSPWHGRSQKPVYMSRVWCFSSVTKLCNLASSESFF